MIWLSVPDASPTRPTCLHARFCRTEPRTLTTGSDRRPSLLPLKAFCLVPSLQTPLVEDGVDAVASPGVIASSLDVTVRGRYPTSYVKMNTFDGSLDSRSIACHSLPLPFYGRACFG